jgi:serine/threonine protein kinase
MASDRDSATNGVSALFDLLRESGDGLEAASPDFDTQAGAARLRRTARLQGLVHGEFAPENELAVQGDRIEEESPPFDVDVGVARLGEAARAQGLLGGLTADDHEALRFPFLVDYGAAGSTAAMTAGVQVLDDRYRPRSILADGGFGRVWLADDLLLGRRVVLKELLPSTGGSRPDEARRRALAEAQAMARINHPSVSRIFDVFEADERSWVTMEYIEGSTLEQVVHDGPLEDTRIAEIGVQILGGLHAAHAAGFLHRDVKPANVIVSPHGRAILVDFGIARIKDDPGLARRLAKVPGTLEFMAPERFLDHGRVSPASDLWSLGATLYYAMEGRSPFRRGERDSTIDAILHEEPSLPGTGQLSSTVLQLLRKDPAARPDALTTAAGLEAIRHQHDSTPTALPKPFMPRTQRRATAVNRIDDSKQAGQLLPFYLDPHTKLFLVALIWCRPWLTDPSRDARIPKTTEIARAALEITEAHHELEHFGSDPAFRDRLSARVGEHLKVLRRKITEHGLVRPDTRLSDEVAVGALIENGIVTPADLDRFSDRAWRSRQEERWSQP